MSGTRIITAAVLLAAFAACHKNRAATDTTPVAAGNEVKAAKTDPAADMASTGAAYKLDSIALKGDVLSVWVNYSGGCKEHSFELVSNGMYAKSMPPQLSLCLKHSNNEDMCKKLVMQELKFDLSSVRYKGGSSMIVKVGEKSVSYNY